MFVKWPIHICDMTCSRVLYDFFVHIHVWRASVCVVCVCACVNFFLCHVPAYAHPHWFDAWVKKRLEWWVTGHGSWVIQIRHVCENDSRISNTWMSLTNHTIWMSHISCVMSYSNMPHVCVTWIQSRSHWHIPRDTRTMRERWGAGVEYHFQKI